MKRCLLAILVFGSLANGSAQMTPSERAGLGTAMQAGVLSEADLEFGRQSRPYPLAPALIQSALAQPIRGIDEVMKLHGKVDPSLKTFLRGAFGQIYGDKPSPILAGEVLPLPATVAMPENLRASVGELLGAIASSNSRIRTALSSLNPEEKRGLIESLPLWAAQGTDIKIEFVKGNRMSSTAMEAALAKVDFASIRGAAEELSAVVERNIPALREAAKSGWRGSESFAVSGIPVEISGMADDEHRSLATGLCVDLGGRNRYSGRYGAGIGYASVLIDLGNDTKADFLDAGGGAGILGIGIAHFLGVRPDLYGKALCYGAGAGGVGIAVLPQAGRIESRSLGQGFGIAGFGALILGPGSDNLKLGYLGQGAGMQGGTGWLTNGGGNDRYRVGGLIPDSVNPGGFLCRAQGYCGLIAGGIGLLTDLDGDDLYEGGTDVQASARLFGIGSLLDAKGNDTYLGMAQGQSSATNEGVAALFELGGDETYVMRKGSCHASATLRAVSILLDREGDDLYAARDSRPALAQEGSVAVFLDGQGSDRYAGPVGVGTVVNGRPGVALFVNIGGDDAFAEGPMPGTAYATGQTGVAAALGSDESIAVGEVKPGSISANVGEIDNLWEQIRSGGPRSAPSARRLAEIGTPALARFCSQFAGTAPAPMIKVAAALVLNQAEAKAELIEAFGKANPFARSTFFQVAMLAKIGDLKGAVSDGLKNEVTRRSAVRYAVVAGNRELLDQISGLVLGADLLTAEDAMIALSALADESITPTMEALITNPNLIIRRAALDFLAKSARGLPLGQTLLARNDEKSQLLGVELMGLIGTPEALKLAGSGLNSASSAVKIKTLNVLNGRVPEGYRQRVLELINDENAVVKLVAKGMDLGRQ